MAAADWLVVGASIQVAFYLFGWCSLCCTLAIIATLAWIKYIIIPLDCDVVLRLCELFGKKPESLQGRVVWITGASTGIGAALAIRLARAGVRLALSARSVDKLKKVKEQCVESGGVRDSDVLVLPLDVLQYEEHQPAFDKLLQHFGKLDILVNNVGRTQRGRWEEVELKVDRELFDLNVFTIIALSRIVIKYFQQQDMAGHIAVTSSNAGKFGAPRSCSYTGSKHALHGYFETLRVEKAGQKLSISMVCPGPVVSDLTEVAFTEKSGENLGEKRTGKMMSTERCADLFAIALANKLPEVWMALKPIMIMAYFNQYLPVVFTGLMQFVPLSVLLKLRDGGSRTSEGGKKN